MNTANLPATLSIGGTQIHQHKELYSLTDLHQASGGESKHQPAFFLRNEQTQALIAELCSANLQNINPVETVRGRGKAQGTYACRELVIAYAAWISAEFHLKVIRVFLDAVAPAQAAPLPPPQPQPQPQPSPPVINPMSLQHMDNVMYAISQLQDKLVHTIGTKLLANPSGCRNARWLVSIAPDDRGHYVIPRIQPLDPTVTIVQTVSQGSQP